MRPYSVAAAVLLLASTTHASAAPAAPTMSAPFQLQGGHAERRQICFAVSRPGEIRIRLDSRSREPIAVIVSAGSSLVATMQVAGSGTVTMTATPSMVAESRDWAISLQPYAPAAQASGRITVNAPDAGDYRARHAVDGWIAARPAVAFHLTWRDAAGAQTYSRWPAAMQQRLWTLVDEARRGRHAAASEPPANAWIPADDRDITTAFTIDDARELYLTTVAQSLAIEMDRRVPWSVDDLNEQELAAIFGSNALFWWNSERRLHVIGPTSHGWAVPAPASAAYAFLNQHGLIRRSRRDTVIAVVEWTRSLVHFAGETSRSNFADFWGYLGGMPVSRALTGTRYAGTTLADYPGYGDVRHYTAGCHGTVGLLVNLLRAVNIPAQYRAVSDDTSSHATVLFLSEDVALTHGDDPYSQTSLGAPTRELLISRDVYDEWMGPLAENPGRSIGRQSTTVALRYLPPYVRAAHARDIASGVPRDRGAVFEIFSRVFTMAELERARLWERLADPR